MAPGRVGKKFIGAQLFDSSAKDPSPKDSSRKKGEVSVLLYVGYGDSRTDVAGVLKFDKAPDGGADNMISCGETVSGLDVPTDAG